MIRRITIISLLIFIVNIETKAQGKQMIDSLEIVEAFVRAENFSNAINFYKRFLMMNDKDPKTNFDLGFCLLNTATGKEEAVIYLEKSTKLYKRKRRRKKAEYFKSYFYLARAYRATYQFDKAIAMLYPLREKTKQKHLKSEIDLEIQLCKDGIKYTKSPTNVEVKNMGEEINSYVADHSPVFSGDEKILIFTSRREMQIPGVEAFADMDGQYDENIFICKKEDNGKWSTPKSISPNINTADHEASIALSLDGKTLLLYKEEDEGSIYQSTLTDTVWSKPKKLGKNINTSHRETHASLSADGSLLYFTSDRPGGFGKLDIYVSKLQKDGSWGKPKNLGSTINSEANENSPYIHPNGKTLYYSSKMKGGLGGYDIYKAEKNQFNTWTKPQNIGYPINTIDDDVFYLPTADGIRAYYSSQRSDGFGWSDLYVIELKDETQNQLTVMSGFVFTCAGQLPHSEITVTSEATGNEWYYRPDSFNGKFVMIVERGKKYSIITEANGKVIYNEKFTVSGDAPFDSHFHEKIRLDPDVPCLPHISSFFEGQVKASNIDEDGLVYDENIKITVTDFLFDFNKKKYVPTKKSNIKGLIEYLKQNPTAVIEIGAYADSKGKAAYNYDLSRERGNSVMQYLLKNGVKEHQLQVIAYGEENPLVYNKLNGKLNPKLQKYNRRIEFRIVEFGKSTLLIRQVDNIPSKSKNPAYSKKYKKRSTNTFECKI